MHTLTLHWNHPRQALFILEAAEFLREADRMEAEARCPWGAISGLWESWKASKNNWAITTSEGEVAFIGGITEDGEVWMVGTEWFPTKYHPNFLRNCRWFVDTLNEAYPRLHNIVDSRNTLHLRWLEWCGFTIDRDHPQIINGVPFFPFERIHKPCA